MRTPTALLRICALLGNQNAREKVSIRDQLKPITLNQIRNHLPTGWSRAPRIDPGVEICIPRAKLSALPPQPRPHEAALPGPGTPTSVSNRLASIVARKDTSWLHHGLGARIPVPQDGKELHPLALQQQSVTPDTPMAMDALDRQALSLIQAEKDLTSFFGEMGEYDAEAIHVASLLPLTSQTGHPSFDDDCDSDSESISSLSDSDSEDEWEALTQEELEAADLQFDKESRAIEAFDAMLNSISDDEATPAFNTPLPAITRATVSPSPPSSPDRQAHDLFSGPTHEDLMADIRAAFAQRQSRQASVESTTTDTSLLSSATQSPAVSPTASSLAAGLINGFALLSERHKESLSSHSSDSGQVSDLLDPGAESDHGWSDSEA